MVTTTVGMVDWVHGHTTSLGPRVPLRPHRVVLPAGLQERLVDTSATRDNPYDRPAPRRDHLYSVISGPLAGMLDL